MPELPEVETTLQGIRPYLRGQIIRDLVVRERRLRFSVTVGIRGKVRGRRIRGLQRRGKYILADLEGAALEGANLERGGLLMHLGMSGSFRVLTRAAPAEIHDHYDLVTDRGIVRYRDPRRFGCLLWSARDPRRHRLIRSLGVEPLDYQFNGLYLYEIARGRAVAIKNLLMNSRIVVGVGNIYAAESLFIAGIHPFRAAGKISIARYQKLADAVREVLAASIVAGGTTIRDFAAADRRPGYFARALLVYGRAGEPCARCKTPIRKQTQTQRSTFYCPRCQR